MHSNHLATLYQQRGKNRAKFDKIENEAHNPLFQDIRMLLIAFKRQIDGVRSCM